MWGEESGGGEREGEGEEEGGKRKRKLMIWEMRQSKKPKESPVRLVGQHPPVTGLKTPLWGVDICLS